MAMNRRRRKRRGGLRAVCAAAGLVLVIVLAVAAARMLESGMTVEVKNAGQQLTSHTQQTTTAQVFMNGRWYAKKDVETLLVMGIDTYGALTSSGSYNNTHQVDFLALYILDPQTGESRALHLNRDTMTDITTLGVTGKKTGTRRAQLALAYNYGSGDQVSSANVVTAVEYLLYGIEVDHYITMTMDAVPIVNDWVGGVTVEVLDDFAGIDDALVQGQSVKLEGAQALTYVRTRKGLDDSSNLHRMERQRQYAAEWLKLARPQLEDTMAIADLVTRLDAYYRTDCTVEQLESLARSLSASESIPVAELQGEAIRGEDFMEFYVDEDALQQLVLELFYYPVDD